MVFTPDGGIIRCEGGYLKHKKKERFQMKIIRKRSLMYVIQEKASDQTSIVTGFSMNFFRVCRKPAPTAPSTLR